MDSTPAHPPRRTRRAVLRAALALVATSAAGSLLAACGGENTATATVAPTVAPTSTRATPAVATPAAVAGATNMSPSATTASSTLVIPSGGPAATSAATVLRATAVAARAVEGRVVASAPGVPDAYLKAPPAFKAVGRVPGSGSKVSTLQLNNVSPAPPRDQNRYWQELEKRLGVSMLDVTLVPAANYSERLAAITASGDLPDLVFVSFGQSPDQARVVQQGAYTDLTPYLTGNALKEYPNLAAYPEKVWKNAMLRGKLYGVPRLLENGPPLLFLRQDWANTAGTAQPKNAEEFLALMTAFTRNDLDGNGKQDSFGLGASNTDPFCLAFFQQVFRVPNGWRLNGDGSLTNAVETEEFRGAVAYMRRLFEAGVYHPDAATMTQAQARDAFVASKIGALSGVYTGLPQPNTGMRDRLRKIIATGEATGLVPFGHDGGRGVTHLGPGFAGYVMIPAKVGRMGAERVKELLRIVDYFAALPFSEEYIFLQYGIEGVHHETKPDGSRALTDLGGKEISNLNNLNFGTVAFYYPHAPMDAVYIQKLYTDLLANGIENPVGTAYSPTQAMKAGELNQLQIDRIGAIVTGREPLSALDTYVRDWRGRGGDQIRREFGDALKA